ncbi:F-box protein At2g21930-like [Apium graveolens]|uniref:F-box protein At2g21930-like n=1 Tax=Apium graveolens TaxID=4045 RepID=UPI003D7B2BD8
MASSKDVRRIPGLKNNFIPDDLLMNILRRLPVKTLLRFKSVSKHWLSFITNPTFVDSHLRHASENNESLLFHTTRDFYHNAISLCCHIDSIVDLPYFEGELLRDFFIVGSCNGIVCVASVNRTHLWVGFHSRRRYLCTGNFRTYSVTLQLYLWNPATKKSNLLPSLHSLVKVDSNFEYVGFGFDPISSDFKVVRFTDSRAMVYTTNTSAWKEIKHPEKVPSDSICDDCINGVLYWTRGDSVIRYDLNNEVFYIHRVLADVQGTLSPKYQIMEMMDSIAVIMYEALVKSKVTFWTVDDGFQRSWTLRYSFDVAYAVERVHGSINNNGDILYKTRDGVWWLHNLDKNERKIVRVPEGTSEVFKHTESLVSITGSGSEEFSEMLMKRNTKDQEIQVRSNGSSSTEFSNGTS